MILGYDRTVYRFPIVASAGKRFVCSASLFFNSSTPWILDDGRLKKRELRVVDEILKTLVWVSLAGMRGKGKRGRS
jgi:hypothetical protein